MVVRFRVGGWVGVFVGWRDFFFRLDWRGDGFVLRLGFFEGAVRDILGIRIVFG